jgi:hypothetical protein
MWSAIGAYVSSSISYIYIRYIYTNVIYIVCRQTVISISKGIYFAPKIGPSRQFGHPRPRSVIPSVDPVSPVSAYLNNLMPGVGDRYADMCHRSVTFHHVVSFQTFSTSLYPRILDIFVYVLVKSSFLTPS